jgi:hypothetical protein
MSQRAVASAPGAFPLFGAHQPLEDLLHTLGAFLGGGALGFPAAGFLGLGSAFFRLLEDVAGVGDDAGAPGLASAVESFLHLGQGGQELEATGEAIDGVAHALDEIARECWP